MIHRTVTFDQLAIKISLIILVVNLYNFAVYCQTSKIDSKLATRLEKGEKLNILVSFGNGVRPALDTVFSQRHADRGVRNTAIVSALKENSNREQQDVVKMLSTRSSAGGFRYYRQYWTSNKMFVREADLNTVKLIADNPVVRNIILEPSMQIEPFTEETIQAKQQVPPDWNNLNLNVTQAWEQLGGNTGQGVIVGIIDTGVNSNHEALAQNFRTEYGWFDAVNGSAIPVDFLGHGTACLSVAVGGKPSSSLTNVTVGVASGAQWMACRACGGGQIGKECSAEHLLDCIQFMSCPTLPDGSNPNCSKAPHVLSFSIGGSRNGEPYDDDFLTLKELGIIPVAAVGNTGSDCGTSKNPANLSYVIAVGGTKFGLGNGNLLVGTSGRGPAPNGAFKPDIVAPGADIRSANHKSNNSYVSLTGTSLAAPHVAGVLALLHVQNPNLTFEQAYKFITESAITKIDLGPVHGVCINDGNIPNNYFGYGLVNALNAVIAQMAAANV